MLQEHEGQRGFEDGKSQYSQDVQHKWFKFISNKAHNTHWGESTEPLLPAACLGAEFSKDQLELMNPSIGDLVLSKTEQDAMGAKAKKKTAQRRHDFVDGNAKSCAKTLNCPTRMRKLEDCNKMQACLADVHAERDKHEKQKQLEKEQLKATREKKKADKAAALEAERKDKTDGIVEDVRKGENHFGQLTVSRLCDILRFCFAVRPTNVNGLRKMELVDSLTKEHHGVEQAAAGPAPAEEQGGQWQLCKDAAPLLCLPVLISCMNGGLTKQSGDRIWGKSRANCFSLITRHLLNIFWKRRCRWKELEEIFRMAPVLVPPGEQGMSYIFPRNADQPLRSTLVRLYHASCARSARAGRTKID